MIVTLYIIGLLAITYLIYRYARYNPWKSTPIGRAFMASKTALLAIILFALSNVLWPGWQGEDVARLLLVGYALGSIFYQLSVVIRFQGGLRRKRMTTSEHGSDVTVARAKSQDQTSDRD